MGPTEEDDSKRADEGECKLAADWTSDFVRRSFIRKVVGFQESSPLTSSCSSGRTSEWPQQEHRQQHNRQTDMMTSLLMDSLCAAIQFDSIQPNPTRLSSAQLNSTGQQAESRLKIPHARVCIVTRPARLRIMRMLLLS